MQYVLSTAQILSATVKYVLMKKKENLNFLFTPSSAPQFSKEKLPEGTLDGKLTLLRISNLTSLPGVFPKILVRKIHL